MSQESIFEKGERFNRKNTEDSDCQKKKKERKEKKRKLYLKQNIKNLT